MEISYLYAQELKIYTELESEIENQVENFIKELESIMNSQAELRKTRTEMQNTLEGINSR